MNILHIVDERWDSGITHYALTSALALRQAGHKVWILTRSDSPCHRQCLSWGLPVLHGSWLQWRYLRWWIAANQVQVINAHTGQSHALALGLALSQPVAVIRTRGDIRPPKKNILMRWVLQKTTALIASADFIRREYVNAYPGLSTGVFTVYGAVDHARFPVLAVPDEPVVGMVGRFDPVKGHGDFLLAAAIVQKKIPHVRFRIAGLPANIRAEELKLQAHVIGLRSVTWEGRLRRVEAFMSACSLGVIASRGSEAVSRVLLEWMACGRPVVSTRVGCIPEILQDGVTGYLVKPQDPEALAEKIIDCLSRPELLQQMGRAAREKSESHFSLAMLAERTEKVYAQTFVYSSSQ